MDLIIKPQVRITGRVEIARSFSFKLNVGNFESRDFFASQKAECEAEDAEVISAALYHFCKKQVMQAVTEYQHQANAQFAPTKERKSA